MTATKATQDTVAYAGRAIIHFHPGRHFYTVSVPSLGKEKIYQPGVTTIVRMKDKSGPLCWWTAAQCEAYCLEKIEEMQQNLALNDAASATSLPLDFVRSTISEMRWHYREVAKEAADIGTTVHAYLHRHLEHSFFAGPEPVRPAPAGLLTAEMCEQANAAIEAGLQFFSEHKLKPITLEQPVWSAKYGYIGTDDFIGEIDDELSVCDYKTSKALYSEVWLQTAAYQHAYQEEYPRAEVKARWGINIGKDGVLDAVRRGPETFAADFAGFLALLEVWRWDRVNGEEPKAAIEIIGELPAATWLEELEAA
jgi:hypothetical protein